MAANPPDPIPEILTHQANIFYNVAGIRVFLNHILVTDDPHVNNLFDSANASLDTIIQHANELRNIIKDQNNNKIRLEEYLRQELNNSRASVLNIRRTFEDAYMQELRHRQYWEGITQNTQAQLANSQIQLANTQTQLGNIQRERNESRRNAHRLLIQPIMAGYAPKKFRGTSGEDPELWLQEFRQWCESAGLDPATNARTCVRIHGIFESLLEDDARDWYETHIKGKNWEYANIRNNTGVATIAAINAMNNATIGGVAANQFIGSAFAKHGRADADATITSTTFIPNHTV
ncbi:hypothetical protein C1646_758788 [Rhizophagus diaphanus]|nr:hypothetical protein C1646_758788 [Rhizophagus diaphanus] [Rhizophagus sp. MUCL 43196]